MTLTQSLVPVCCESYVNTQEENSRNYVGKQPFVFVCRNNNDKRYSIALRLLLTWVLKLQVISIADLERVVPIVGAGPCKRKVILKRLCRMQSKSCDGILIDTYLGERSGWRSCGDLGRHLGGVKSCLQGKKRVQTFRRPDNYNELRKVETVSMTVNAGGIWLPAFVFRAYNWTDKCAGIFFLV